AAARAYSATASGVLCAERTSSSQAMPRASSSSSAGCIRSRSDSEPTSTPTTGSATRHRRDVASEPHALEGHLADRLVDPPARLRQLGSERRDREDTAPARDQAPVAGGRPAVEDDRPA